MRRSFLYNTFFIVLLMTSAALFAQSNKEDIEIIQASFGKDKKQLISEYMQVQAKDSVVFWKLYDEYEGKRKELGRERLNLIQQYVDQYESLDDKKATQLATISLANDSNYNGLYTTYYKKFSTAIGGKEAAKLFQLEFYLQSVLRLYVMEKIPFIGELEKERITKEE